MNNNHLNYVPVYVRFFFLHYYSNDVLKFQIGNLKYALREDKTKAYIETLIRKISTKFFDDTNERKILIQFMATHHDDEPLFSLELGEHRSPLGDTQQQTIDGETSTIDNDDDNRFVDNDTGVDLTQPR